MNKYFILLINMLLAMLLGLALAYWSWQLWEHSSPSQLAPQDIAMPLPASNIAGGFRTSWFGGGAGGADLPKAGAGLQLVGTFAASQSQPSYALIAVDGGRFITLTEGKELSAGLSIQEIFPDHVTLRRNDVVERLDLNRTPPPSGLIVPLNRSGRAVP